MAVGSAPVRPEQGGGGDGAFDQERITRPYFELVIRIAVLAVLLYWAVTLVRPFATIAIWSAVIAVALYPTFEGLARLLGGRRRLAAFVLTIFSFLVVIGPATWLTLDFIESLSAISQRLDLSTVALPAPPKAVQRWPVYGEQIYQYWSLASNNIKEALVNIGPHLKPLGSRLLSMAASAGTGALQFLVSIIVAGFLFCPAKRIVGGIRLFARKLAPSRADELLDHAGATIRAVSRGVIGISVLQALLVGIGLVVAGVPGASLLTSMALVLGIVQIGPAVIILPLVVWSWFTMDTTMAILFTVYMVPVNLIDNILKPIVMTYGLNTPMLVIVIGVIGGTVGYGITGLFLGPIILTVIWELLAAWVAEDTAQQPAKAN